MSVTDWTFLSDHAHVLVVLARDPRNDARAVAGATGIDIDRVRAILHDLEEARFIRRERRGGTDYTFINREMALHHAVEGHHAVGRLLDAIESSADALRDRIAGRD